MQHLLSGQHPPPPQQSASLDEFDVALVSVRSAAIKSKYFISISCLSFVCIPAAKTRRAELFGEIRPAAAELAEDRLDRKWNNSKRE